MIKFLPVPATLVATTALLATPAAGQGHVRRRSRQVQGRREALRQGAPKVGYSLSGTLVSLTADNPATAAVNEATLTLTVTVANKHARNSGEIADQHATTDGVQVAGATYTVTAASDAFSLLMDGFEAPDTPSVGDAVKVNGKIAWTKKKCAAEGVTIADRYATPDIRKVTITDSDADA